MRDYNFKTLKSINVSNDDYIIHEHLEICKSLYHSKILNCSGLFINIKNSNKNINK